MSDDDVDDVAASAGEAGVGYGRPPKQTRFKPGQSGNRGGRPRGSRGVKKIVEEIAFETYVVTEDGKRTRRSTIDLVAMALRRHAMRKHQGHPRCSRLSAALRRQGGGQAGRIPCRA